MSGILCPNPTGCGHDINLHDRLDGCRPCQALAIAIGTFKAEKSACTYTPADIARALLNAEPTEAEVEAARDALTGWGVGIGWDMAVVDPGEAADMARAALEAAWEARR